MADIPPHFFSRLSMIRNELCFDDIFKEICPKEFNEFGLKREIRFISERIIAEYDPNDTISVREIIHPMAPHRTHEPFFTHHLTDKAKNEFVTAIDFHEHITYFPYAKNNGEINLARYISNFNDINFTKISGQTLCSLPGETIYGLRVGRLDKGMMAVSHRSRSSVNSTVTVMDLVKPARNLAYFDSPIPVNTIDWIWHGPFHLAIGDDKSLRIVDVRCPKAFDAVYFEGGVKKTALSSTRPIEIACYNGKNVLLYDIRRPEVPCDIYNVELNPNEKLIDMKFNPYLTNELFVHTDTHRVMAIEVNPARLLGGAALSNTMYEKWQIITFKHIDRGCFATRHTLKRRELMPYEEEEIPLHDYDGQYETAKLDPEVPIPSIWQYPSPVDNTIFDRLHEISEYEFEGYLSKAVERVLSESVYHVKRTKKIYEATGVESFDFVFPGVNGIMCFDRKSFSYQIHRSPKHYEGCVNPYAGSDSVHYFRGIQIQEMIPAQTLKMMCDRLKAGWNAYQTSETNLKNLAFTITDRNSSIWANWLRNSAIMQYGGKEFGKIGGAGIQWQDVVKLPSGPLPDILLPPNEQPNDEAAAEEVCKMIAPFLRLFLPDPVPDLKSDTESESEEPEEDLSDEEEDKVCSQEPPFDISEDMRILCKCHAKIRYYESKKAEKKYMYKPLGKGFLLAASKRVRDKFFQLGGWHYSSKSQILAHRVRVETRTRGKSVLHDLKKFERFKPREFQKRVLPPKLITDSTSVFMKPEYIKEREEKEKEMREKAAKPITAPIGMSMTKSRNDDSRPGSSTASLLGDVSADEDPERARFLIRAALQLGDDENENLSVGSPPTALSSVGQSEQSSAPPSAAPTPPVPSAFSTVSTRENDDFEYETAEDAFFGIKKKRMYVVYKPATAPLGLKRYKADRLRENTFIRRLEHLVYYGSRKRERRVLQGDYEENHRKLSTVIERNTLDLKEAFHSHVKLGWQTFYDKYFFFSDKCSFNQLLRKVVQMYNALFHSEYYQHDFNVITHERLIYGIRAKNMLYSSSIQEALELRTNCTLLEPTVPQFNQFMNFLQAELPYQLDTRVTPFEYDTQFIDSNYDEFLEKPKKTANYDAENNFMMPVGRLQFCEYDIPPAMMELIMERRKPLPSKKRKIRSTDLEEALLPLKDVHNSKIRRANSCPALCMDVSEEYDEEVLTEGYKKLISKESNVFPEKYKKVEYFTIHDLESKITNETLWRSSTTLDDSAGNSIPPIRCTTEFCSWDSPMILLRDKETGLQVSKRVIPFPEPQPPRQIKETDVKFDDIPLEVRQAARNIHVSWLINIPIIYIYPGMQIMDVGRDVTFTYCSPLPRLPKKESNKIMTSPKPSVLYSNFEELNKLSDTIIYNVPDEYPSEVVRHGGHLSSKLHIPIFEEMSFQDIPLRLIDYLKPSFYGTFTMDKQPRFTPRELIEMRSRRDLQQEILERRLVRFRQPVIEETDHELELERMDEEVMVEDDLKTSSDEEDTQTIPENGNSVSSETPTEDRNQDSIEEGTNVNRRKFGVRFSIGNVEHSQVTADKPNESSVENSSDNSLLEQEEMEAPIGSPHKDTVENEHGTDSESPSKELKSVSWGNVTEHNFTYQPDQLKDNSYVDVELLREIYSLQFSLPKKPIISNWMSSSKNSGSSTLSNRKKTHRRGSVERISRQKDPPPACPACIEEPWPTRDVCLRCQPDSSIYFCTRITNLQQACRKCGCDTYKFSCGNYERHALAKKLRSDLVGIDPKHVDEVLIEQLSANVRKPETAELVAPWDMRRYTSGEYTVDKMFETMSERFFHKSQYYHLTDLYHREFHFITWHMDDDKSEKIFNSEQFAVAFDRDADIDMMRDTMNTISQDGDMDMMTTYDQKSGMRIRRWISYAALATRLQKQQEKQRRRRLQAEREAKILSGEISIRADMNEQLQQLEREKAKEPVPEVIDWEKVAEEQRAAYRIWKKLPIPKFIEDPKKEMPNFGPSKGEDWLESSGSEDELPPIRSRMLSAEIREFITTIKRHMARKPEKFDGLRVTYGKLFERRPILKNDIVLVTQKKNRRRKPPPFRIQRIPLDARWLNDSLTVSFVPPNIQMDHPKDSDKWTVPFYSSKRKQLNGRERKREAYRPPTPPPTIKKEYVLMKEMERAYYHQKRINQQKAMKKAKVARLMRYRKKLVGFKNIATPKAVNQSLKSWEEQTKKSWTREYKRAIETSNRQPVSLPKTPQYPLKPLESRYIFAFKPKKSVKKQQNDGSSSSSSSEVENCPVLLVSPGKMKRIRNKLELKKIPFEEEEQDVKQMNNVTTKSANPLQEIRRPKPTRRGVYVNKTRVSPIQEEVDVEQVDNQCKEEVQHEKVEQLHSVAVPVIASAQTSLPNLAQETPVIVHIGKTGRGHGKREEKVVVTKNSLTDVHLSTQRARAKSISRQFGSNFRPQVHLNRSFSVDRGSRLKKEVKRLVRKKEKTMTVTYPKIPSFKKKKIVEKVEVVAKSWHTPSQTNQQEVVSFVPKTRKPISTSHELVIPSIQSKIEGWSKKLKKMGIVSKKRDIYNYQQEAIYQKSKSEGSHRERPIQPRWLPTSHETERSDDSPSQYQFQHMRTKRFTRKRTVLHKAPVRSRVLNTIRKLADNKNKNVAMMYKEPLKPEIAEIHLNPWKSLPTNQDYFSSSSYSSSDYYDSDYDDEEEEEDEEETGTESPFSDPYQEKGSESILSNVEKEEPVLDSELAEEQVTEPVLVEPVKPQFPSMSWRQMLKKLTNYHVKISRVRLKDMKMFKKVKETDENDDDTLEIMIAPTPNLKSSMKNGKPKRKLNYASKPLERKEPSLTFGSNNRLVKTPTSSGRLSETPPPKSVKTVPSLLKYHIGAISTPSESGRDTPDSEASSLDDKRDTSPIDESLVVEPQRTLSPLRLLKPVDTPLASTDILSSPKETSAPPVSTPSPKIPSDQQWRAAMMSRRNMGNMGRPPPIVRETTVGPPKIVEKTPPRKETPAIQPSRVPPAKEEIKYNTPVALSELTQTKKNSLESSMKLSEQFLRPHSSELSPQSPSEQHNQMMQMGILPPLDASMWPIEVEHVIDLVPDSPKGDNKKKSPEQESKTRGSTTSSSDQEAPKKKSFFSRLFSSSGSQNTSIPSTSTPEPIATPLPVVPTTPVVVAQPSTISPINQAEQVNRPERRQKTPPLLPRIKKPESGQLLKRPTKNQPTTASSTTTGRIVKIVDGKPVYHTPTLPKPMSQRRSEPAPVLSSSSSSDEEEYIRTTGHFETTSSPEEFPDYPLPDAEKICEPSSTDATSVDATSSEQNNVTEEPNNVVVDQKVAAAETSPGKSVTFADGIIEKPDNDEGPSTSDARQISSGTPQQEKREPTVDVKSESKKLLVPPVTNSASASTQGTSQQETKTGYFLGFSPFGRITLRQPKPIEEVTPTKETQLDSESSPPGPSTSQVVTESSSSEKQECSTSSNEKLEKSTRPTRKTSTRRQLKIADPSPLQLSGHAALPRPAEPSPERPPHLELPREVQNYKSPSQRKYYTKGGQEWTPEKDSNSTSEADENKPAPPKKPRRRVKKKPAPFVKTLVLDGTKHFSKLTRENLEILDRQNPVQYKELTPSLSGFPDPENFAAMSSNHLLLTYQQITRDRMPESGNFFNLEVDFDPALNDDFVTVESLPEKKLKRYETCAAKLNRWMRIKNKRIQTFGANSSKRDAAISAVRQARRIKHVQIHGKKMMPTIESNFKPKSILKTPASHIWWYRIDGEGNKIYLKNFGPSEWQQKIEQKKTGEQAPSMKVKSRNKFSYLRCWTHVMSKLGEEELKKLIDQNPKLGTLPKTRRTRRPDDVIISTDPYGRHPPTRSLSSMSVSSNESLTSLLEAAERGEEAISAPMPELPPLVRALSDPGINSKVIQTEPTGGSAESLLSKNYPVEYVGLTVPRSSPPVDNLASLEAVETVAQDGSQILEYVGQEETTSDVARRRFDPFVRPLSALFTALSSSSTEIGLEAGSRSRPTHRRSRFGQFFRRQSTREQEGGNLATLDNQTESLSQGSSAEDILALMRDQPNALEQMEERKPKPMRHFQPPEIIPPGRPMYSQKQLLFNSLYSQFEEKKRQSRQRKMDEYYNYRMKLNPNFNCTTMRNLINFNMDEYLRISRYPRPSLDFNLLGKYPADSLKIRAKSQRASDRAAAIIISKLEKCRTRLEKAKTLLKSVEGEDSDDQELTQKAICAIRKTTRRVPRKVRVQYKFKKTCVKYRVEVTLPEKSKKMLRDDIIENDDKPTPTLCKTPSVLTTIVEPSMSNKNEKEEKKVGINDYDGDDDGELEAQNIEDVQTFKRVVFRKNQKKQLLRRYFLFAVKLAKKIARRSLGKHKPLIFYAFISQIRSRMRQFMNLRREDQVNERQPKLILERTVKKSKVNLKRSVRKSRLARCPVVRDALKFGNSVKKPVVIEQSKFSMLKKHARFETFFECLDEYIDVGTPIRLVYKSSNTILPQKAFDTKTKMVDSDTYITTSPCETDSDFSEYTPENSKITECKRFFNRNGLESTYRVKGLPGLIYLARLVQERIGDDVEQNSPFMGPGLEDSGLLVYMSPIRRLMLNSMGLRMPDRIDGIKLRRSGNEKFHLWFERFYQMICYGRGDACKYIVDMLSTGQGQARKVYERMDVSYQARVVYKLYKKMIYINNGREARLGVRNFLDHGLDLEMENPYAKPFKMGEYDWMMQGDGEPWTRDDWTAACDQFLKLSMDDPDVYVHCRASVWALRMVFLGGYSQDIVDEIVQMRMPMNDKLIFIINLTPPDHLVENIVKVFHTVRGLDRLPFVGLGYHADPMQVLFEEALESGDPQLIAHLIRVGRCLDRRSGEPLFTECSSDIMNKRDLAYIMSNVLTNGEEKQSRGAPTMDEMFPIRYVRHDDGTYVTNSTEELAVLMECEVTRYMAILELTKGAAVTRGDLDHNPKFAKQPKKFIWDVLCTGCKVNVAKGRNLGKLGRILCVSTMPLIEQDKDRKRWPNAKTMSPRLTFENYIETLDPTENKMIMAKDIEEEKTDITVQLLPSRFGCYQCRFELPRCSVCMCSYLNDHMDYALKELNERFSQFSVCNLCNHGGHVNHIAQWFATEKYCPVAGCDCRCLRNKRSKNLRGRLRRHMLLSANMRAKSHLCQPQCGTEVDIDEGFLPDPDLNDSD